MFTRQQAIRAARHILRNMGISVICTDSGKNNSHPLSQDEYRSLVSELVSDTIYWEM